MTNGVPRMSTKTNHAASQLPSNVFSLHSMTSMEYKLIIIYFRCPYLCIIFIGLSLSHAQYHTHACARTHTHKHKYICENKQNDMVHHILCPSEGKPGDWLEILHTLSVQSDDPVITRSGSKGHHTQQYTWPECELKLATACCDGTFQTCRKTGTVKNYTSYMTGTGTA